MALFGSSGITRSASVACSDPPCSSPPSRGLAPPAGGWGCGPGDGEVPVCCCKPPYCPRPPPPVIPPDRLDRPRPPAEPLPSPPAPPLLPIMPPDCPDTDWLACGRFWPVGWAVTLFGVNACCST